MNSNLWRRLSWLSLSLLLWASPSWAAPQPAPPAQTAAPHYVVQAGDTLFEIAGRFGVSVDALLEANPGVAAETLAVGASLSIPGLSGISGTLSTHAVEPGETLDSLALRLGLRRETLVALNGIVNPELLYINQPVIIVLEPEAGFATPNAAAFRASPEGGLLAFAAAHNQNPWALAAANRLPSPIRAVPAALWVIPGGEMATRALPYPLRELQLQPFPAIQGHTLSVHVTLASPAAVSGSLGDWTLTFNPEAGSDLDQYALQGIHRFADPDLYPLTIAAAGPGGQVVTLSQRVAVRAGDYLVDLPLTVDPETIDPAVTEPENEQVQAIVSPVTPVRLWNGPFALPSVGALRSAFGSLRSYNGGPYNAFHAGVDYSGGEDRPITAPAAGVVVFAGPLVVRGNATIIDHGWGVYSGYWHQSVTEVQVGDRVDAGQVIGYNGATGRVTGPHLHWELWVGGVQVNPEQWTMTAFP